MQARCRIDSWADILIDSLVRYRGSPAGSRLTARGTVIQNVSFLLLVALTTVAFLALIGGFLMPVFWAAVLATVFFPLQSRYVVALGGRRSLAALPRC